ncbi:hypothetical protein BC332_27481 [Capsicum chinense]|nr:hypothetical protein BC332_27481 [Capsicum chinense]
MVEVMSFLMEKLKEAILMMFNFGGHLMSWFDEVFPPETRVEKIKYWFHIALPYLIITVYVSLIENLKFLFQCCWRSNSKMMKAPGRNIRIPRSGFEKNPRLYFTNLRAYPGDMHV